MKCSGSPVLGIGHSTDSQTQGYMSKRKRPQFDGETWGDWPGRAMVILLHFAIQVLSSYGGQIRRELCDHGSPLYITACGCI